MSITRRRFGLLAAGSGLALAAPSLRSAAAAGGNKIGVVLPMSGPLASTGNDVFRGFEVARALINDTRKGVLGQPVEFAVADVPSSTEATSQAQRLISNDKVSVIVGSHASSVGFAASQVAERNKVIFWEQGAVADDITSRNFKYLFRIVYRATEFGRSAADYLVNSVIPGCGLTANKAKIAILQENSNLGTAIATAAKQLMEERKINIIDHSSYNFTTTDLSSIVQRYKSSAPDCLFLTQYTPDAILFWRQAREAGLIVKAALGSGPGHNDNEFARALGDDVNGVFSAGTSANVKPSALTPEAAAVLKQYQETHQKMFEGRKPSAHTLMGFNAMWLMLAEVIPAAGSFDSESIRKAALAMDKPVGSTVVGWGVKFDPKTQDNTRAFPAIDQWQQKQLRTVYPAQFATAEKAFMPLPEWGARASIGG
jgi:branched-chain amino acid transport system substrate-binding protein